MSAIINKTCMRCSKTISKDYDYAIIDKTCRGCQVLVVIICEVCHYEAHIMNNECSYCKGILCVDCLKNENNSKCQKCNSLICCFHNDDLIIYEDCNNCTYDLG